MPVNDLTNTTWLLNDTLNLSPLELEDDIANYTFDVSVSYTYDNVEISNGSGIEIGAELDYLFGEMDLNIWIDGNRIYGSSYYSGWYDYAGHTITITGGTDATNADLIAWLEANAVQQVSPTPSQTNNLYFGSTKISKLFFGTSEVASVWYGNTKVYEAGGSQASGYTITLQAGTAPTAVTDTFYLYDGQDSSGTQVAQVEIHRGYMSITPSSVQISSGYIYSDFAGVAYSMSFFDGTSSGNPLAVNSDITITVNITGGGGSDR